MPIVLNTNASATEATFNLSKANDNLRRSIARLSSGNRITKPTDDAGGLAVAYKLNSSVKRTEAALNNHQNALSFLQVQDGVLEAIGEIVDRMAELRTMAADVSKNAADVENYSKEFLELQDQLTQMKREKFNGVELFAVENEQDTMQGINKSHLVVNGELHDNVNGKTYANKAEYEYFDDPLVDRRTKSTFDKYEFQLYTHPTGVAEDGNIKLNIVNLQFMLGLKDPNEQFGVDYNVDSDGDGQISHAEWAASTFDRDGDGRFDQDEWQDSGLSAGTGWMGSGYDNGAGGGIADDGIPQDGEWDESPYNVTGSTSGRDGTEEADAIELNPILDIDGDGVIDAGTAATGTGWKYSGYDNGAGGGTANDGIIDDGEWDASPYNVAASASGIDGTEEADAIAADPALDLDKDGSIDTTSSAPTSHLSPHYVDGFGNTIAVGNTLNLAGLNQPTLDTGDGAVHPSNSTVNGGLGTNHANSLTSEGYIKDITKISIEEFTNIIEKIADVRAENGAEQQRVNQSLSLHQNNLVNLQAAHGRIMDVDVAMESTRLARHSVTVQASAAMVAQANQMTAVALTLLSN